MDHFKQANDSFGHLFGDSVLVEMADKIKKLFRSSDVIGRIGGDEFVVFLKDIANEKAIVEKAREICESMRTISLNEHSNYKVSCSIGIAVAPKDSEVYLDLFKKADEALYYSKNHGKESYTFYNSEDMAAHHYPSNR
jgi:diguanylate cyclase (GGDEF)-like protein